MKTNKIQWKRISAGEELPCDSFLMRYDGTITRGTCAGVKAGQDAYYLPVEVLRTLPKEESEDDKIRNFISNELACLRATDEKGSDRYEELTKAIDWLEKQGEKRTKLVDFDLNANDSDLQEETYFIPDGCYAIIEDNKVILRKRENKPKFRVGDTIKCKHDDRQFTVKSIDLGKGTYTYTQDGCGNDIDYADEEFELVEQKPWSEEDEKMLGLICEYIPFSLGGRMWLKSLKDRVLPQPRQEWSEEDKTWFDEVWRCVSKEYPLANSYIFQWLKSLRPRSTWKPSDDEMKALAGALSLAKNCGEESAFDLRTLYEQLKKLREE